MLHRCPGCSKISEQDLLTWGNSLIIPFNCPYCDTFYWLEKQVHQDNTETEVTYSITDTQPSWSAQIPEIELGIDVYITNAEHEFHLERGVIVDKDHVHYRVLFTSQDERLDNKKVWVPENWVARVPEGL